MRTTPTFFAVLFACMLLALPAQALVMPPLPEGACPLDNNQKPDRDALSYMHLTTQTPATLKALFTECAELGYLRNDKLNFLSHYGAVFEHNEALPVGTTRAQAMKILGAAAGMSGTIAAKSMTAAQLANSGETSGRRKTYTASEHSVLKQTDQFLILGSEQRHIGTRLQYAMAVVTALTVVGDRVVAINLYAPLEDGAFQKLTLAADSYARSLIAVNPS